MSTRTNRGVRGAAGRLREPGAPGAIVRIGSPGRREDSIYNPPPPEYVEHALDRVLDWTTDSDIVDAGDAGMGLSLPIRLAVGHAHFEAVHPFSDGNGRIGRVLWALQMAASGRPPLYLSGFVEAERDEYATALQEAQKRLDYSRLVRFVCEAIVACADEESKTREALAALPRTWRTRRRFRRGSTAARCLDLLVRMPIVTAQQLTEELGVSLQAATGALDALENAGIVRERSGRQRRRVYAAEEVTQLLSRPFGGDPADALLLARETLSIL